MQVKKRETRYDCDLMGTCCIPWTEAYTLDEQLFRQVVRHLATQGTRHLYIFGTAGEGHAVSTRQFQQITRVFAEEMRSLDCQPMVGVITPSLSEVLDRVTWAGEQGVTQFQISLPSWGTCTPDEAFVFFETVCNAFPDFQFMHYNLKRAGRLISAEEYGQLAAALPNLVAAKLAGTTAEDALAIQAAAPALRLMLTEKAFAEMCALGGDAGLLLSYASMNWGLARQFYEDAIHGRDQAVLAHRKEQQAVLALMREAVGDGPHMDGAFDTMFIKCHVPAFPLRLLPPYQAVDDEAYKRFVESVARAYPHWLSESPMEERATS